VGCDSVQSDKTGTTVSVQSAATIFRDFPSLAIIICTLQQFSSCGRHSEVNSHAFTTFRCGRTEGTLESRASVRAEI
jgi:hypothetical protein